MSDTRNANAMTWLLGSVALSLVGCGEPCKQLEEKMCQDLGEDCQLWRDNDRPGFPGTGRRATRSCVNALGKYDTYLQSAKTVVEALKKGEQDAKAGAAKAAERSSAKSAAADEPAPPKKDSEECTALEDKICKDLGEAACSKWKDGGKAGLEANAVQCKMALEKSMFYDKHLKSVKDALK